MQTFGSNPSQWNIAPPQDPVRFFGNDTQQADLNAKGFAEGKDKTTEILDLLANLKFSVGSLEYVAKLSLSAEVPYIAKDITGTLTQQMDLRAQSFAHRDQCMSDFTLYFAGQDKTVLWAHNYHIQRPSKDLEKGLFYQGQFLEQTLAEKYKAIALTASKTEIYWHWLTTDQRGPLVTENSLEKKLADSFPNKSVFLTNKVEENIECGEYCEDFKFDHDKDISARFDGLVVLPYSGPIEYVVELMN